MGEATRSMMTFLKGETFTKFVEQLTGVPSLTQAWSVSTLASSMASRTFCCSSGDCATTKMEKYLLNNFGGTTHQPFAVKEAVEHMLETCRHFGLNKWSD